MLAVASSWIDPSALPNDRLAGLVHVIKGVAFVTVNWNLLEVIELWVAVTFADPTPAPVAKPPAAIVTADRLSEAHVTEAVMFEVEPSLKVPVAVN
jgi:hypothetical protein